MSIRSDSEEGNTSDDESAADTSDGSFGALPICFASGVLGVFSIWAQQRRRK